MGMNRLMIMLKYVVVMVSTEFTSCSFTMAHILLLFNITVRPAFIADACAALMMLSPLILAHLQCLSPSTPFAGQCCI